MVFRAQSSKLSVAFSAFDAVGWVAGRASGLWTENWVVRYWHGYLLERGANDLHMVQLMPLPSHHLLLQ